MGVGRRKLLTAKTASPRLPVRAGRYPSKHPGGLAWHRGHCPLGACRLSPVSGRATEPHTDPVRAPAPGRAARRRRLSPGEGSVRGGRSLKELLPSRPGGPCLGLPASRRAGTAPCTRPGPAQAEAVGDPHSSAPAFVQSPGRARTGAPHSRARTLKSRPSAPHAVTFWEAGSLQTHVVKTWSLNGAPTQSEERP